MAVFYHPEKSQAAYAGVSVSNLVALRREMRKDSVLSQVIDFMDHSLDSKECALYNALDIAGWSSLVARWAHNPKVDGSNPSPATKQ